MARLHTLILPLLLWSGGASAREVVDASAPQDLAVTVYRDPNRGLYGEMNRDWPQGFAMISETRQVTLPPGESTIRFTGVAEGMVAVSAIVTGLPGGTIEKNRNADLLSPAALVDGTLGNRVRITRTNPGTGQEASESAIIRTRADGGLVLQTSQGFEAVRCSGLPERLTFDAVPDGLSAQPVFSIDTRDAAGGTYQITLTYLAWGFDWQANYVATLHENGQGRGAGEGGGGDDVRMRLMSWLTILNDNNQSFEGAELMAVAGTLNVVSDFQQLADPPDARPLQLTCYPFGSTAAGSPEPYFGYDYAVPPPPAPMMAMRESIVVTGARMADVSNEMPQFKAEEEQLGDLKLYRIPENVTVSAQGLKQVAFLDRDEVAGRFLYETTCQPFYETEEAQAADILFATVNDEEHGLGVALPSGSIAFFEPSATGELLVGEENLRDYASGQDVEIGLGQSSQVFARCQRLTSHDPYEEKTWSQMRTTLTNANPAPVSMRVVLGSPVEWDLRGVGSTVKNGRRIVEVTIPANGERVIDWQVRPALAE
ncbi:DUF4139 domain-containing protein [Alteraurantiacibacter aestuarii]|uniref:DUF4139 domain-containing protein n=1 Tax=Alteraurantiacibacter aestuarii TaxID=650004 RepID=A0A844ZKS7_9SPHN|nr:hypothetical protein [Alteraurantiacibacter aestuarii]MXO87736.1 hypothetical protein [Alteraurantiacibacter aestuarii]